MPHARLLVIVGLLVCACATPAVEARDVTSRARSVTSRQAAPAVVPDDPDPRAAQPGATTPPDLRAVKRFTSVRDYERIAPPTRVRIPVIGVTSGLEQLDHNPDGTIEVPAAWDQAGWYRKGARPGQPGAAVILGHVDSRAGPAVFYRLGELRPGDEVFVDRRDGSTARFVVTRLERHGKDRFPTDAVYFPTVDPVLRLITCGGEFDYGTGHYRDNVIAFATLAD